MAKILVIDDVLSLLETLRAYLEDNGYEVLCAQTGAEGLEKFQQDHPDVILTDLHMPDVSGLQVLETVYKAAPNTPVIMISGAGEINDVIQALRLGAWDYITKPIIDLEVLDHAVKKALDRKYMQVKNQELAEKNEYNLKILQEDQAAGRQMQMSLLPAKNVTIGSYNIDYEIVPSLALSGDFVEYYPIDKEHYGVYLADVCGHGSSSAFITVLLKSVISQYIARHKVPHDSTILSPADLMQVISEELHTANLSKYITIIYGILNITTGEFNYCVGGHYPSPILRKVDGTTKYLPGTGFPIGIQAHTEYQAQKVIIEPGDTIVMFSDGVMEVFLPGQSLPQKDQGLLEIVSEQKSDLKGMLNAIKISNNDVCANYPDDITVLIVCRSCA